MSTTAKQINGDQMKQVLTNTSPHCCQICNDTASGKNYTVHTCESCRTFFKRNGRKVNKLTCRQEGKCPIDFTSRRKCSRCRLEKGLSLGMAFKGIKCTRRQKIKPKPKLAKKSSKGAFEEMLDNYISTFLSSEQPSLETPSQMTATKNRRKYATNLSSYERHLIGHLQECLSLFEDERKLPVKCTITKLKDSLNWHALYVGRVVAFCKAFPTFNACPKAVQLLLLKRFYDTFLAFRWFLMFDYTKMGFYVLADEAGTESIFIDAIIAKDYSPAAMPLLRQFAPLVAEFRAIVEDDTELSDLIFLFILFRPGEKLPNLENINYEHAKCCRLLLHYLEQKHKVAKTAADKFRRIVRVFNEFDVISSSGKDIIFKEFDISLFSDVLVELYDLHE